MIPAEVIKKIKKLEIKTRQVVNTTFAGQYHSVFKGQGIDFSEVREYSPGDEIRLIDWKVTARAGKPFIKVFEEERELTVMLLVDLSSSGNFGSKKNTKLEIAAEIAAVLGFSAINNKDKVGLLLFTDRIEKFVPPKGGQKHVFILLRDIFYYPAEGKGTSIATALDYVAKTNKKKAIIFIISDFQDVGYERNLQQLAKKHDVVPIILEDEREQKLPKTSLVALEDEELGEVVYINTNSKEIREKFEHIALVEKLEQERFFKSINVRPIRININESYFDPLTKYFQKRAKHY
jgi:uncharacterized protein (DUF58 family)